MMMRYEDALDAAISSVRSGEPLEAVLARTPEHAEALRDDLRLTAAVRDYANTVTPSAVARGEANQRLMATLQSERRAAALRAAAAPSWRSAWLPRVAIAAAVVAIGFVAFAALDRGAGPTVEAATIEGVVLENADGSLTVQTLDALEQITVPSGASVSDASGATIPLNGIAPGEVVLIQAQRRGERVVAQQVARLVANIEAWCNDASERCEALTDRLRDLEANCGNRPAACRIAVKEINQLRMRAAETARLEGLKALCRSGGPAGCEELASFCREHQVLCANIAPFIPASTMELRESVRQLLQACQQGDAASCRKLTQVCQDNPGACPNAPARRPDTSSAPPTATPIARPTDASPPRPAATAAATATSGAQRLAEPTATPLARDGQPTQRDR